VGRQASASLRAPSQSRRAAGNGTVQSKPLSGRMAQLEDRIASLERQLAAQLRRTGEIQAQLDRAIKAGYNGTP